jgi:hypothetical protein
MTVAGRGDFVAISSFIVSTQFIKASTITTNFMSTLGDMSVVGVVRASSFIATALVRSLGLSTFTISTASISTQSLASLTGNVTALTGSTIQGYPISTFLQRSGYNNVVQKPNLSTTTNIIASTFITVDTPSFIFVTADMNVRSATNQFHNSFLYTSVSTTTGLFSSLSTVVTIPNNIGSFVGQGIVSRFAVSTGTWACFMSAYATQNGVGVVTQCDLSVTGNMIPSLLS